MKISILHNERKTDTFVFLDQLETVHIIWGVPVLYSGYIS